MPPTTTRNRIIDILTLAALGFAAFLFLRPGSMLHSQLADRRARAETRKAIERHWTTLAGLGSSLSRDGGTPQVVEISDYECPYCRKTSPVVDSAIATGVRVAYLHLPLPIHPAAMGAALAALCAEQEGKFAQMHERLMYTDDWRKDTNWTREAKLAGMSDTVRFAECMRAKPTRQKLARHVALADSLKADGTPMFFSNKGFHKGVITVEQLRELASTR
jgi:protein-disulfide isomerase